MVERSGISLNKGGWRDTLDNFFTRMEIPEGDPRRQNAFSVMEGIESQATITDFLSALSIGVGYDALKNE